MVKVNGPCDQAAILQLAAIIHHARTMSDLQSSVCSTTAQVSHVFVYGTLRQGEINDITRLDPSPVFVGLAQVHGVLYHLGAYPGLRLEGSQAVVGEVYEIAPPLAQVLDEIEGLYPVPNGEYTKERIDVEVGGVTRACAVYVISADAVQGRPILGTGDWVQEKAMATREHFS